METEKLASLVRRAQQGDGEAANELYTQTHQGLYYYLSKTVNDPDLAQDLLQETYMEIYETLGNLQEPAAFLKWSRQIAYHKCTAYARKRREITAPETEDGLSIFDTIEEDRTEFIPDEALDKEELKQTVNAMLAALPMEQRSAIMLRYYDEISVKEIAQIQGVSEGTVKSRLNYGRKALQKSVEEYEKKSGVKLRCAGAVPLLLWLFREYAGGSSAASKTAAAAVAAGAKKGAKAVGKALAKKWIAGVTAAAVVAGGAALLLQEEEPPMAWYGYGTAARGADRRFELTVEEMDDSQISGHLETSYFYTVESQADFTGTGTVSEGTVSYTIVYDRPLEVGLVGQTAEEMTLEYSKETDTFSFRGAFSVDLQRASTEPGRVLMENALWSGLGEDGFDLLAQKEDRFEVQIHRMTGDAVTGTLTLTGDGQVDHRTQFTGRGGWKNGSYRFEVLLETPRTDDSPLFDLTADRLWLIYDPEAETLELYMLGTYSATLKKVP